MAINSSSYYNAQDQLTKYGTNIYTYTLNGELKTKGTPEGVTVYDHDPMGNLVQVILPNSTVIGYTYDGKNRRVAKMVNGFITERLIYKDQLAPIAKVDADGNVLEEYVYGTGVNSPDYIRKDGVNYRVIKDHLGSIRMIDNASTGEIVKEIEYDEFGNITTETGTYSIPFGFAGGLQDRDTGLIRFGARDYDPMVGRWTSKEPLGFNGASNFYVYAGNDPVNFVDVNGLKPGDYFKTMDAAAVDAMDWTLKNMNGYVEWGGLIIEAILSKNYDVCQQSSVDDETWYFATGPFTDGLPEEIDIVNLLSYYTLKNQEKVAAYYHTHTPKYKVTFSRHGSVASGRNYGDIEASMYLTAVLQQAGLGKLDAYVAGFDDSLGKIVYGYFSPFKKNSETYWSK